MHLVDETSTYPWLIVLIFVELYVFAHALGILIALVLDWLIITMVPVQSIIRYEFVFLDVPLDVLLIAIHFEDSIQE